MAVAPRRKLHLLKDRRESGAALGVVVVVQVVLEARVALPVRSLWLPKSGFS